MRFSPLPVLLLVCGLLAAADVGPDAGTVRSYARSVQTASSRASALKKLEGDAALRDAVAAQLVGELDTALAAYAKQKPDGERGRIGAACKELYAQCVAQKQVVGHKFPVKETKPDFLKLVELHEQYFSATVAFQNRLYGPAERRLIALRDSLRLVDPAAKTPDLMSAFVAGVPDEVRGFLSEDSVRWTTAKQVWLFNETRTPWAKDYQRASARAHNGYRLIHLIAPAELHPKLNEAAQAHADEMVALKYFNHVSPVEANKTWDKRIRNAGYPGSPGSENLAWGSGIGPDQDGATVAVIRWFWDPHHNPLINPGFTQLGCGIAGAYEGCSYGASKTRQSTDLAVEDIDLAKLITIDYPLYKAAFGGGEKATSGK